MQFSVENLVLNECKFTAELLVFHAHKFQTLKISKHPQNLHTQKYSIKAILLPKKTLKLLYTAEEKKNWILSFLF